MNLGGNHTMLKNTGWLPFASTASFSNVAGAGFDWTIVTAVLTEGGSAPCTLTGAGDSDFLQAVGLSTTGLSSSSVILGVEVRIKRTRTVSAVTDHTIQLIVNGAAAGDNKSAGAAWDASGTPANADFGGAADTWGLTLTAADVMAAGFGFHIKCTAGAFAIAVVDFMAMRITYRG